MAATKGRSKRKPSSDVVTVFARVKPEAKAVLTRGGQALGISEVAFLEELLTLAGQETTEGIPRWAAERAQAQQDNTPQLDMEMSA